ncbi:MAG: chemotaxis protein [Firmicutes bacterium]|nr:chemotaxis protein [Bacillota bacterium]
MTQKDTSQLSQNGYNVKRVHKVNLAATIIIVSLLCVQVLIAEGFNAGAKVLIASTSLIILCIINYCVPIYEKLKSLFFAVINLVAAFGLMYADGFTLNKHYLIFSTIAMITLYFKKELIVIFGIIVNCGYLLIFILRPENLLSDNIALKEFVTILTLINGIMVLLFFLTKWGNDLVEKASKKEAETAVLLEQLGSTFRVIDEGAHSLNQNISVVDTQLKGINEASQGIVDSVQQMATAIQEEASSVYRINESMTQSLQVVNQSIEISNHVVDKSEAMSKKVEEGFDKINEVSGHMTTVNSVIETTSDTVADLKASLTEVSALLNKIKTIAGQTNLLALNASIESARAGEQGKGFAVVADNIRSLSEQSKKIVEEINVVTSVLFEKSESAARMSKEGELATKEGMDIIREMAVFFADIKESYQETNTELSLSMKEIQVAAKNFIEVQEQITNVASISEENSASTEEILSIIEDENSQIAHINTSVTQVYDLSRILKDTVKQP